MEANFKAMVLAAGVGSRLAPLTDYLPKPLVKIGGRPIMEHIILQLKKYGAKSIVTNTHHLSYKIHDYFADAQSRLGIEVNCVKEEQLTGVAGGIRKCASFLKDSTACIIMGDALMDVDLGELYAKHREAVEKYNCQVSMAIMEIEDTTQFGVVVADESTGQVKQFQEKPKAEDALSNWANTGIYFFEPAVIEGFPTEEEELFYDVAKHLFPKLLAEGKFMQAIPVSKDTYWADIGTPQQYVSTMKDIVAGKVKLDSIKENLIETENIDSTASLLADNEIGEGSVIEAGVTLKNCVLFENVHIKENAFLENCIIADNVVIEANTNYCGELMVEKSLISN